MSPRFKRVFVFVTATLLAFGARAWSQPVPAKVQGAVGVPAVQPLVTFVELGSVKCIPCRQMQPVMKAIEGKYGTQVVVVFHDVWKDGQRAYAEKYGIKVIPTQVFLDKDGKEFFRHEGFFPESEIDTLLQKRGLRAARGG